MHTLTGGCHCRNITYEAQFPFPAEKLPARYCSCNYCRMHGGYYASHPEGVITLSIDDTTRTSRYRFGSKTTDFLICTNCGIVAILLDTIQDKAYGLLRLNTLDKPVSFANIPWVNNEGEDPQARRLRRLKSWTPVTYAETSCR